MHRSSNPESPAGDTRPSAGAATSGAILADSATGTDLDALLHALEHGERERIRRYLSGAVVALFICIALFALLPYRHPLGRHLGWLAVAYLLLVFGWLVFRARQPSLATVRELLPPWAAIAMAPGFTGVDYAWGMVSPVPVSALIALSLLYYIQHVTPREGTALYVVSASSYLALGSLVATGVIPDYGPFATDDPGPLTLVAAIGGVQVGLGVAFAVGMINRRDLDEFRQSLHDTVALTARREALLLEAREDLENALGHTDWGRFSDSQVGSYRLHRLIGRGGMGEVYEGEHAESGARAAVKVLRPETLADPSLRERFAREARFVSQVKSPHVVEVLEVGLDGGGVPFIAMEHLEGVDLGAVFRTQGQLPEPMVSSIVEQACAGLEAVHRLGVIHRDIKPQNLYRVNTEGREVWKIIDFGVSKLADAQERSLTVGALLGTPTYMSPEQARGSRDIDHRTDLYSLAVVAYRGLTGQPAFAPGALSDVVAAIVRSMPADPSVIAGVSEDMAYVLRIAMDKSPEARFPTAAALAEAFGAAARGELPEVLRTHARVLLAHTPWGDAVAHLHAEADEPTRARGGRPRAGAHRS